jgi:integrase
MATIRKRGEYQWCAQIEKKNRATGLVHKEIRTFITKDEAEEWAKSVETDLARGIYNDTRQASGTALRDLIVKYRDEVTPRKKGAKQETVRLNKWLKHELADRMLTLIQPSDFAGYISDRRKDGKAEQTIKSEIIAISNVFKVARVDWCYKIDNPIKEISKPGGSRMRDQRILPEVWPLVAAELDKCRNPYFKIIGELAIETAMRQGEIFALAWADVDLPGRHLIIREAKDTTGKNQKSRIVPLSRRAIELLQVVEAYKPTDTTDEKPLPLVFQTGQTTSADGLSRAFTKACAAAGIPARFHDTRHEACSRMAPHFEMHELMKITGHETAGQLIRYYNPTARELTDKLDRMQSARS